MLRAAARAPHGVIARLGPSLRIAPKAAKKGGALWRAAGTAATRRTRAWLSQRACKRDGTNDRQSVL